MEEEIGKVAARRKDAGGKVEIEVLKLICDVQSDEDVGKLEEGVRNKWGRVDVVVANAGIISKYVEREDGGNLPIGVVQDGDWARVLDINLMGVWRISMYTFLSSLILTQTSPRRFPISHLRTCQQTLRSTSE